MFKSKFYGAAALVAGLMAATLPAVSNAAVDVSDVVTEIEGTLTPIGAIGVAVLLVVVGIKTYKWVKRAF